MVLDHGLEDKVIASFDQLVKRYLFPVNSEIAVLHYNDAGPATTVRSNGLGKEAFATSQFRHGLFAFDEFPANGVRKDRHDRDTMPVHETPEAELVLKEQDWTGSDLRELLHRRCGLHAVNRKMTEEKANPRDVTDEVVKLPSFDVKSESVIRRTGRTIAQVDVEILYKTTELWLSRQLRLS